MKDLFSAYKILSRVLTCQESILTSTPQQSSRGSKGSGPTQPRGTAPLCIHGSRSWSPGIPPLHKAFRPQGWKTLLSQLCSMNIYVPHTNWKSFPQRDVCSSISLNQTESRFGPGSSATQESILTTAVLGVQVWSS